MSKILELADAYAVTGPLYPSQREARAALVAEVEKLERDAARYRWLREEPEATSRRSHEGGHKWTR